MHNTIAVITYRKHPRFKQSQLISSGGGALFGTVLGGLSSLVNTFQAFVLEIVSTTEYYPFGSPMPNRSFNTGAYRYGGAGGQEMDNEISGVGNSYTAEFWQYDSRLGRRWNVDPVDKPWLSSYHSFSNNPIINIDPKGDEGTKYVDKSGKTLADVDDGSDNIYVVDQDNQEFLKTDLQQQADKGNLYDANINNKLGEKYGFEISKMSSNMTVSYPKEDLMLDVAFENGYNIGYQDKSISSYAEDFVMALSGMEDSKVSVNYFEGRFIGGDHRDKNFMNMFNPKLSENKPLWHFEDKKPIIEKTSESFITYNVQKGDNLTKIAREYNTSIDKIAKDNNITNKNMIQVNQNLTIQN